MAFDVRPFWMIGALCGCGFGLLVLLVRKGYPDYLNRVLLFLGAANLSLGASYSLRFAGLRLGQFAFEVLSSTLVVTCLSLEYQAVCELKRRPPTKALLFVPPLLTLVFCTWFSFLHRNISIQLALVNLMVMGMFLLLACSVGRAEDGQRRIADLLTSATYTLLGVATCGVILDYIRVGQFSSEYNYNIRRSNINNSAAIVGEGLILALFLLMVSERLNRTLVFQAMRDPLTDLFNRRAFEEIAFREMSGASRSGLGLSVLMFDVDHFKKVNDQYGHATGDAVLKATATTLRRSLRDEDFLCRWGGDEFCALLPRAKSEQARSVADRVIQGFSEADFPVEGKSIKIAVSVGAASYDGKGKDFSSIVKEADSAMYRTKQAGRNGIDVASSPLSE